ncbi:MAG: hypothetical protein ACK5KP_01595 [Paludibacteraceae bacterium]
MFLFESLIFSTFIPQILMFLGVVSCFSISFFSSSHDADNVELTFHANEIVYTSNEQNQTPTFHFSDYQFFQEEIILPDTDDFRLFNDFQLIKFPILYPPIFSFESIFSLFSRPPPCIF